MSNPLVRLYVLLACHMLGDYVLQSDFLASTKGDNAWHLLAHCASYTVPFAVAFGIDWRIAWLLASHLLVDALKARWHKIDYLADQAAHFGALLVYLFWEVA